MRPLLDILTEAPLFAGVSRADLKSLVPRMRGVRLQPGQRLVQQGHSGDSVFVVLDGRLAVRCLDGLSGSLRVAELGPGDVLGDMAWLDPGPRSATVEALETVHVAALDRNIYDALVREDVPLAIAMLDGVASVVAQRLARTNRMLAEALGEGVQPSPHPSDPGRPYEGEASLGGLPAALGLDARDMRALRKSAPAMSWGPGEALCRQGERGDQCFFIAQGEVEVVRELERVKVLARLSEGEVVGQLSLIADGPRTATVRAVGEVVALVLTREALRALIDGGAPAGLRLLELTTVAGIRQLRLADEVTARLLARPGGNEPPLPEPPGSPPQTAPAPESQDAPQAVAHAPAAPAQPAGPDDLAVQEALALERRHVTRRQVVTNLHLQPAVASYDVDFD